MSKLKEKLLKLNLNALLTNWKTSAIGLITLAMTWLPSLGIQITPEVRKIVIYTAIGIGFILSADGLVFKNNKIEEGDKTNENKG
jgi:multisubunit Na+/H+ antiporter MnhB subunit